MKPADYGPFYVWLLILLVWAIASDLITSYFGISGSKRFWFNLGWALLLALFFKFRWEK